MMIKIMMIEGRGNCQSTGTDEGLENASNLCHDRRNVNSKGECGSSRNPRDFHPAEQGERESAGQHFPIE